MKLSHLRTFVAIADNSGFARAAGRLNMTQSAASRQISALESELGVSLFDRDGRQVKLTSEGDDLLRRSRRLLADAHALGERARALKGGQVGTLSVSATPQTIENLLASFLGPYRRRHPGIEVQLLESGSARYSQLEQGEIHLAIMPAGDAQHLRRRLLHPVHALAVLARTHRYGRRAVMDIVELAEQPLLLLKHGFGVRAWFDAACNAADIHPHVLLESGAPTTLMALAEVGYGIAVVPSNVNISRKAVRAVQLVHRGESIGRWASIAWNPHRFLPLYAEQFVEELVVEVRHAYPGRDITRRAPPLSRPKE
jgi:LysR family transcriptional regulator, cyn operon transcriptional activator